MKEEVNQSKQSETNAYQRKRSHNDNERRGKQKKKKDEALSVTLNFTNSIIRHSSLGEVWCKSTCKTSIKQGLTGSLLVSKDRFWNGPKSETSRNEDQNNGELHAVEVEGQLM